MNKYGIEHNMREYVIIYVIKETKAYAYYGSYYSEQGAKDELAILISMGVECAMYKKVLD